MLNDDGIIANTIDALNKTIHAEPNFKATHLVSAYPKDVPKTTTLGRSDSSSALEPAIELLDQLTASGADLPPSLCGQLISEDRHSPAAVLNPPRIVTLTPCSLMLRKPHLKGINGDSERFSARDVWKEVIYTECTTKIYDCPGAS